jgi:hypothetical protein
MTHAGAGTTTTARSLLAVAFTVLVLAAVPAFVAAARADSTPVGALPRGPVATISTGPNQLVAVALPHASKSSGLVWRLARPFDSHVVRQVSESDLGANVVLVFKVVGRGKTSLIFALTRGDSSAKAVKAATHKVVSR